MLKKNRIKINLIKNKKSIIPVITKVLLLVMAIVIFIFIQNWFNQYKSSIFSTMETDITSKNSLKINSIKNGIVSINNDVYNNLGYKFKIDGINCNITGNLTLGENQITIIPCLNISNPTPNLILITDEGIKNKNFYR